MRTKILIRGRFLDVRLQGFTPTQVQIVIDHAAEYGETGEWSVEALLSDYADEIADAS
jgi:hypothetical protein